MTAWPQLVVFDLDGTLTDSAAGIVSSFRHALAYVAVPVERPLAQAPSVSALREVLGV